jgi:hypothetical protein
MTKHYIFDFWDDCKECEFSAFRRPKPDPAPDEAAVYWYLDSPQLSYFSCLVRVKAIFGDNITFTFLHNVHGTDLPGDYQVDLSNYLLVHREFPSTAPLVDLQASPEQDCGFLFLSESYLQSISKSANAAGVNLAEDAIGDGKWPRSAGSGLSKAQLRALGNAVVKIEALIKDKILLLSDDETKAFQHGVDFLQQ